MTGTIERVGDASVPTVVRAADSARKIRLDDWRQAVEDNLGPMDIVLDEGPDHRDEIASVDLGTVRVTESSSGPGEARRTARHVRRSDLGLLQLVVVVRGTSVGEQPGWRTELGPGELSLADLSRPLRCVHKARRAIFVTFPRALLARADVSPMIGARIPGDRGTGALIGAMVRQLPRLAEAGNGAHAARLGAAVVDVLAAALAARHDTASAVPVESHRNALRVRVHAFIDEHLGEPGLSPATIARSQHISVRYLHKLFESETVSVAALIRQRRLDRCRRELLDPGLVHRPVSAIAARWGFPSTAHFTRAFREVHGLPPAEFRSTFGDPTAERSAPCPVSS
jgi:AraC-like DNA-binding protein